MNSWISCQMETQVLSSSSIVASRHWLLILVSSWRSWTVIESIVKIGFHLVRKITWSMEYNHLLISNFLVVAMMTWWCSNCHQHVSGAMMLWVNVMFSCIDEVVQRLVFVAGIDGYSCEVRWGAAMSMIDRPAIVLLLLLFLAGQHTLLLSFWGICCWCQYCNFALHVMHCRFNCHCLFVFWLTVYSQQLHRSTAKLQDVLAAAIQFLSVYAPARSKRICNAWWSTREISVITTSGTTLTTTAISMTAASITSSAAVQPQRSQLASQPYLRLPLQAQWLLQQPYWIELKVPCSAILSSNSSIARCSNRDKEQWCCCYQECNQRQQ